MTSSDDANRRNGSFWSLRTTAFILTGMMLVGPIVEVVVVPGTLKIVYNAVRFVCLALALVGLFDVGGRYNDWLMLPALISNVIEVIGSCAIAIWTCYSLGFHGPSDRLIHFGHFLPGTTIDNVYTMMLLLLWICFQRVMMAGLLTYVLAAWMDWPKSAPQVSKEQAQTTFFVQEKEIARPVAKHPGGNYPGYQSQHQAV